jgi:hypothetical protein
MLSMIDHMQFFLKKKLCRIQFYTVLLKRILLNYIIADPDQQSFLDVVLSLKLSVCPFPLVDPSVFISFRV